jgi:aspartate-semialdehyde dehydrogenase
MTLSDTFIVGIVGATGAVGIEVIKCLHRLSFPVASLRLFASERSVGKVVTTEFGDLTLEAYSLEEARKCHFLFLSVSGEFALQHAREIAAGNGPYVIDNSSAFRYMPDIPLVVAEQPIIMIFPTSYI